VETQCWTSVTRGAYLRSKGQRSSQWERKCESCLLLISL